MNNIFQDIAEIILQSEVINTDEEFNDFFISLKNYMLHLYSDEFHNNIPDPYDEDYNVDSDKENTDDD